RHDGVGDRFLEFHRHEGFVAAVRVQQTQLGSRCIGLMQARLVEVVDPVIRVGVGPRDADIDDRIIVLNALVRRAGGRAIASLVPAPAVCSLGIPWIIRNAWTGLHRRGLLGGLRWRRDGQPTDADGETQRQEEKTYSVGWPASEHGMLSSLLPWWEPS